jgi:hypothetical protein
MELGVEGLKKKYGILVIKSEFNDLVESWEKVMNVFRDIETARNLSAVRIIKDSNFVIIENGKEFQIMKSRYAPANAEMDPTSRYGFCEGCLHPIEKLNECIMWMVEESKYWNKEC